MKIIEKLKELDAKATKGPWAFDGCGDIWAVNETKRLVSSRDSSDGSIGTTSYWTEGNPNAALIAELRNALPKLLAICEAVKIHDTVMRNENRTDLEEQNAEMAVMLTLRDLEAE